MNSACPPYDVLNVIIQNNSISMEDFCTLIISCKLNEDDYKTLVQDKYHANINKLRTIVNSIEDKDSFEVERLQTFLKSSITFPIEKETFDDQCFICDDSSWYVNRYS